MPMAKVIDCRDVGVDCDFVIRGETDEEIFRKAEAHAQEAHGMDRLPEEIKEKMRPFIREEAA
jgi:predicted small metal-binding protein